jgi:hypothetical protein
MEADTMDARLMRARMIHKTLTDFSDAATQGVVAIGQGEIAAVNLNEPESTRVFVFNSIFFSVAGDTQDTFKATRGTAAYRKTVNKDVASMGLLHQVDAQTNLSSFATCIVDYFGTRYVAQSVAPGILSFDASSESSKFLEHGAVDNSKPLKTTDEMQVRHMRERAHASSGGKLWGPRASELWGPRAKGVGGGSAPTSSCSLRSLSPMRDG